MLTLQRVRDVLDYNASTGLFTWKARLSVRAPIGSIAGSVSKYDGRRRIGVDNCHHFASRLAWFYTYGAWPSGEVDHINMVRSDDRISNLRPSTHQQNNANRRALKNNALGAKGVTGINRNLRKKYRAKIHVNGRCIHLGYFASANEASEAYRRAAERFFGEFARSA